MEKSEKTGDQDLTEGNEKMLDYLLHKSPRAEDGTLSYTINEPEIWIDSM